MGGPARARGTSPRLSKASSTAKLRQPWTQSTQNPTQGPGSGVGVGGKAKVQVAAVPFMSMAKLREMQAKGKDPFQAPHNDQNGQNGGQNGVGTGVKKDKVDPLAQSTTIHIPDEDKKKHLNRVKKMMKGYEGRDNMLEKNDVSLDLSNKKLDTFNASFYHLYPKNRLNLLVVLILRNNMLTSISAMHLTEMHCLTDLDLGHNRLAGAVPHKSLPRTLERLDLSHNSLDDLSGLIDCPNLQCVNASYNNLKAVSALPARVKDLDISFNLLSSVIHLRLLSFSPSIVSLRIVGNPIVSTSSFCRVIVSSVLPNVETLDDVAMPGNSIRKKSHITDPRTFNSSNGSNGSNQKNGQPKSQRDKPTSATKKSQVKGDLIRTQAHAQRLRNQARVRDDQEQEFLLLAKPLTIGPQATELLVRRLTWVAPTRSMGAEFFYPSMIQPNGDVWSHGRDGRDGRDGREGTDDDAKRMLDEHSVTGTLRSDGSRTSRRSASVGPTRSASATRWRSFINRPGGSASRERGGGSRERGGGSGGDQSGGERGERGERDDASVNSGLRSIRPSRQGESSFSTFGASKNRTVSRTSSAPSIASGASSAAANFKAFARHSDLPSSPSRDRKAAGAVMTKHLQTRFFFFLFLFSSFYFSFFCLPFFPQFFW